MTNTEFFTLAFATVVTLFGGAWLMLNAKRFEPRLQSQIAGAMGLAAAGYFLSQIGLRSDIDSVEKSISYSKSSHSFFLTLCWIAPWLIVRTGSIRRNALAIAISSTASFLLLANYFSDTGLALPPFLEANPQSSSPELGVKGLIALAAFSMLLFAWLAHNSLLAFSRMLASQSSALGAAGLLFLSGSITQALYDAHRISFPHGKTLSAASLALAAFAWVLFRLETKPQTPPVISPDSANASEDDEGNHCVIGDITALVLWFKQEEGEFLSKLLKSRGYRVLVEDDLHVLPNLSPEDQDSPQLVLFDWDADTIKRKSFLNATLKAVPKPHLLVLSRKAASPRLRRKLRARHIDHALQKPLKATELFRTLSTLNWEHFSPTDQKTANKP